MARGWGGGNKVATGSIVRAAGPAGVDKIALQGARQMKGWRVRELEDWGGQGSESWRSGGGGSWGPGGFESRGTGGDRDERDGGLPRTGLPLHNQSGLSCLAFLFGHPKPLRVPFLT